MAQRRWQPLAGLAHSARWGADSLGYLNNGLVNLTGSGAKQVTIKRINHRILTPTARQMPCKAIFSQSKRSTRLRCSSVITPLVASQTNCRPQALH